MRITLSKKIFGLVFSCSVIMIGFMLFFGLRYAKDSVTENISVLMQDKMSNVIHKIDLLFAGYLTQMQIISTDQILQRALSSKELNSENLKDINTRLSSLLIYSGPWDDLLMIDSSGKPIAASSVRSGSKLIEMHSEERALLGKADSSQIAYTDAYVINKEKIFSCIATIKTIIEGKEKIVGYVVGRVAIRSVEDILSRSSENITLFRNDGMVIAQNTPEYGKAYETASYQDVVGFVDYNSVSLKTINNVPYMVTLARERGVPSYQGNGWVLSSVANVSTYIESNQKNINQIIYIVAAIMFLLLMSMVLILRKFVTIPVKKLHVVATALAAGDFKQEVIINSSDEIGDLSIAFRDMANQLSELYNSLEQRVKDKTEELEKKLIELANSKQLTEVALKKTEAAEEKMIEKSKQVEDAFTEVQHFARVADRERLTYSLLISSIGEGVVVVSPEGDITVSNNICANMIAMKAADLIGINIYNVVEFLTPDKILVDSDYLRKLLSKNNFHNFRYWTMRRKSDGAEITISGVIATLIDDRSGGVVRGLIFTFRNVIEEKMLEDARVGFISTASHQLRTPLTSMRWFAEMLHDGDAGDVNEDQKHFLERISEGIDRMIGLVNMLLQIARVEAGRTAIEPVPIDLREIANGVAKTIELQLAEHGQKIEIISEVEPLPMIPLDKDYAWQVIQNLFTNAQRYSFDNTTTDVRIKTEGEYMIFSVKDHGIGIPKDAQPRLFEKFYRADNALQKVPSGTGLGLSLVKMLVEEMGGTLSFESEENVGTTFFMRLPLVGMAARSGEVKLTV